MGPVPGVHNCPILLLCRYEFHVLNTKVLVQNNCTAWAVWNVNMTRKYQHISRNGWPATQIARFMWPTWGPPGSWRPRADPMLAPITKATVKKMNSMYQCELCTQETRRRVSLRYSLHWFLIKCKAIIDVKTELNITEYRISCWCPTTMGKWYSFPIKHVEIIASHV